MRMIRKWEARHDPEVKMENPQFWGAVVGAVASSVIGGLMSDDDGGGSREQAQNVSVNQERLFGAQADTAEWQLAQSKELWDLWKAEQLPLIRQAVSKIERPGGVEGAIAQARGDVAGQYAVARQGIQRDFELGGRNPSDPAYSQNLAYLRSAEAADVANAIYGAREAEQDAEWNRRLQAITLYGDPSGASMAGAARSAATTGDAARGLGIVAQGYRQDAAAGDVAAMRGGYGASQILNPVIRAITQPRTQPPAPVESRAISTGYDYGSSWDPGGWDWSSANDYGGYYGYRQGGAIKPHYADGGEIKGPGTGTSDSIATRMQPGSYVLSADVVRAIGTKKVDDLIEKSGVRPGRGGMADGGGVAVRVSNGEAEIPPETVQYYGEDFFNKLQQKYHRPVREDSGVMMANGGAIRVAALPRTVEDAIFRAIPAKAIGRR